MVSEEELIKEGGEIELELAQPCCSIDTDKATQLSPVCKLPATERNEAHVRLTHHWCTSCGTADLCIRIIATAQLLAGGDYSFDRCCFSDLIGHGEHQEAT